jgi:hypothetical protein
VSVNEPVELDVVVVLAERVDQHLGHLQPPDVKAKLMNKKNHSFKNEIAIEGSMLFCACACTCAVQSQCVIIEHNMTVR